MTNFVIICLLFSVLIVIICLIIYTAPLYKEEQNQVVGSARLIYIGNVNFSSHLETDEDRLN